MIHNDQTRRGYVLGLLLQIVLLLLVLGQVVFLASRHRVRLDLTSAQYFTLTESTQRVLGQLDDRVLIEAYFSPDSKLPTALGEARQTLRNLLDEYVQNARGRVIVQYLDPHSDEDLRERAKRLGIQPETVPNRGDRTLSYSEIWQGMRLRYAGRKQKILPKVPMALVPYQYEMLLTPAIKALTIEKKPSIGMVAQPSQGAGRGGAIQFARLRDAPEIKDRYQITPYTLEAGTPVPDRFEALIVVRPKDLTDRQKFVLDQFLMRGGKLVVFADTAEYPIDPQRTFNKRVVSYDAKDSKLTFLDQLRSYGVELSDKLLLDMTRDTWEGMRIVNGPIMSAPLTYPYWFHAMDIDWAEHADKFAKDKDGQVDSALAAQYEKEFLPGVDPDIAKGIGSPGFFWPCAVNLAEEIPEGLEASVMLRTSPMAMIQDPPQSMSPFGRARVPQQRNANYRKFHDDLMGRVNTEPRQQHGLMVTVSGTFTSFFTGKEIPLSPAAQKALEEREKKEKEKDPLDGEVGEDPVKEEEVAGPPTAEDEQEPKLDEDPEPMLRGAAPGRLVVIGDSDCIRDDLVEGRYARQGGPYSARTGKFFLNLLDWLAEDQDLFELRNKAVMPAKLKFVDEDAPDGERNLEATSEIIKNKERVIRAMNIAVPPILLLAFGLVVFLSRQAKKRAFLASLN